ncbi:unnamed protein product [Pleuronectes platessa]|uniref:Uncharacterized protein n=1 Tax=Pleuronectes platessa TaxID=8262 RepID=A0A9N7U4B3_PLEPL|nr:unnamed protein product [Pleuronectes platessa]
MRARREETRRKSRKGNKKRVEERRHENRRGNEEEIIEAWEEMREGKGRRGDVTRKRGEVKNEGCMKVVKRGEKEVRQEVRKEGGGGEKVEKKKKNGRRDGDERKETQVVREHRDSTSRLERQGEKGGAEERRDGGKVQKREGWRRKKMEEKTESTELKNLLLVPQERVPCSTREHFIRNTCLFTFIGQSRGSAAVPPVTMAGTGGTLQEGCMVKGLMYRENPVGLRTRWVYVHART